MDELNYFSLIFWRTKLKFREITKVTKSYQTKIDLVSLGGEQLPVPFQRGSFDHERYIKRTQIHKKHSSKSIVIEWN